MPVLPASPAVKMDIIEFMQDIDQAKFPKKVKISFCKMPAYTVDDL